MGDQEENGGLQPNEDNILETSSHDDEEKEYNVEAIRAKRYSKLGVLEYLIKWEGYPETANTWEPIDHLECPELLAKFEHESRAKKTARRTTRTKITPIDSKPSTSKNKRPKRECTSYHQRAGDALLELNGNHESDGSSETVSDTETNDVGLDTQNNKQQETQHSNSNSNPNSQPQTLTQPTTAPREKPPTKGFGRGLEMDTILSACVDDSDTLWFLIKWKNGPNDVELIEAKEVEEKAPRELCAWYRKRLYHSIKLPSESNVIELSESPDD